MKTTAINIIKASQLINNALRTNEITDFSILNKETHHKIKP